MPSIKLCRAEGPTPGGALTVVTGDGWGEEPAVLYLRRATDSASDAPALSVRSDHGLEPPMRARILRQHPDILTLEVPGTRFGVYALGPAEDSPSDEIIWINRPVLRWSSVANAEPGAVIRLFGRGLVPLDIYPRCDDEGKPVSYADDVASETRVVIRDAKGACHDAQVLRASCYDISVRLPEALGFGSVDIFVHHGRGGDHGWSEPLAFTIAPATAWPSRRFSVTDFGAVGDGMTDDGPAIEKALDAARANGGGEVYFPAGGYHFARMLRVPPYTVLRGESRERSWLYHPDGFHTNARDSSAAIAIAGEGPLGVEDLSVHAVYCDIIVAAPVPPGERIPRGGNDFAWRKDRPGHPRADGSFIRRCRLLHNFSHLYHRRKDDPAFDGVTLIDGEPGKLATAFALRGSDMEITDSEFLGKGCGGSIAAASHCRVQRNVFHAGAHNNGFQMKVSPGVCHDIIFEDNVLDGTSQTHHSALWMMHGGYNMHIARNQVVRQFWVSDCEGLLGHMWGWRIPLPVARCRGRRLELCIASLERFREDSGAELGEDWPIQRDEGGYDLTALAGREVQVFAGPGLGQTNTIERVEGDSVVFARDWVVPPTPESVVIAHEHEAYRDIVFARNRIEDTGPSIMLWGHAHECVIDGNSVARGGLIGTFATLQPGAAGGGCHFIQIINNVMDEGRVRVLDQHEPGGRYSGGYISTFYSAFGGFKKMLGHNFVGYTVRNNLMLNDSTIRFGHHAAAARDGRFGEGRPEKESGDRMVLGFEASGEPFDHLGVVIEQNTSRNCRFGICIGATVQATVRDNSFENVDAPLTVDTRSANGTEAKPGQDLQPNITAAGTASRLVSAGRVAGSMSRRAT